jgi:hypothetical protein
LPSASTGFSLTLPTRRALPGEKDGATGFPEDHAVSGRPPLPALLVKAFKDLRPKTNHLSF